MKPRLTAIALLCFAAGAAAEVLPLDPPPPPPRYSAYDPTLDGQKQFDDAVAAAAAGHKRVLVMLGGNWCKWCRALDEAIASDVDVKAALASDWVFLHTDIGTNKKLDARLGRPSKHGFPVLVVVDVDGAVVAIAPNGALERGNNTLAHDPKKLLAFLNKHAAKKG